MAKASPIIRSFNGGEFSELMEGRTDLDRYPASMRRLYNYIAAPQGPAICRSGTAFVVPCRSHSQQSVLLPFVFSSEQAKLLEFTDDRIRFIDEDGIQVYASVAVTIISASGAALRFTSATLGANVGDQIVLSDFPLDYALNGEIVTITAKSGNDYTTDKVLPADKAAVNFDVSRVYHVACAYTLAQRQALRFVQSVDVMYLLTTRRPRKLSRYGDYDWRLEDVQFEDGPYMPVNDTSTTLYPNGTGNAIPNMSSDTSPSGAATGSGNGAGVATPTDDGIIYTTTNRRVYWTIPASQFFYAFDADDDTYWAGGQRQSGSIAYNFGTPLVCDGYTIYTALDNSDQDYSTKDFAPGTWTFEAYDGSGWIVLDEQQDYVLYDGNKSVFFELENTIAYSLYRLNIKKTTRNGMIEPRVRRLVMRTTSSKTFDLYASSTVGINNDQGFLPTDVGRLVRLKGSDGAWRACKILNYGSPTYVNVELQGEPLLNLKPIREWRLGYWSDTTGWPNAGDFFEDRLWLVGSREFPDVFAGSVTGAYENFRQTDTFGEVLDDSAIVGRLNSRKLSGVRWISSDDRGMAMGTGSEEYTLSAPNNEALTARNIKARPSTRRGSAPVEPVRVDSQVLFVQRSGRTIREFAYVYESDGYKSPSMSQLASHFGAVPFVEMDYAAEPHSIVWVRRQNGTLVGLTYNRDENVIGWHQHDLAGGIIESLAVLPQKDQLQDTLWVVVRRTVNGQTRRYIERLTRFWDFDTEIEDAHYVDCALRYNGTPVNVVYGMQHLEGQEVYGLADAKPVGPFTVAGGSVTLPFAASNIVLGLGYDSEGETSRLENGAEDGTAMGKVKRINSLVLNVWRSFGGQIGVPNEQAGGFVYEDIEYPGRFDEFEEPELHTGNIGPIVPSEGYDMEGTVVFRRPKHSPLPFNILSIMPQLNTQDK